MPVALVKLTARRTKSGLETLRREFIGYSDEDAEKRLERLAEILAGLILVPDSNLEKEATVNG